MIFLSLSIYTWFSVLSNVGLNATKSDEVYIAHPQHAFRLARVAFTREALVAVLLGASGNIFFLVARPLCASSLGMKAV